MRRFSNISVLLVAALLVSCDQERPAAKVPEPKPTIVCSSYAVANLTHRIMGEGADARVIFPVPAGNDPMTWAPGPETIAAFKSELGRAEGKVAFFVSGSQNPAWLEALATGGLNFRVRLAHTAAGYHPRQAGRLTGALAKELVSLVPGKRALIVTRTATIQSELKTMDARWQKTIEDLGDTLPACGLGEGFESWRADYREDLTVVKSALSLPTVLENEKATSVLLGESALPDLREKLSEMGIETVSLLEGDRRPESGDFLAILEWNLGRLESLKTSQPVEPGIALGSGFEGKIVPVLERYCIDCHDTESEEGEVNFDHFLTKAEAEQNPDLWESVAKLVKMEAMPPRDKTKQPTQAERAELVAWSESLSERWDQGKLGWDPGRTTIRRLNKNEYNYTIRDLFGIKLRPADQFPEDGGGEAGFDNNADALFLPPLLMENYAEAAGKIVQFVYGNAEARQRYLFVSPGPNLPAKQAARKVLERWANAAYRRSPTKPEVDRLVSIFEKETRKNKSFAAAMQMPLIAILISPNFLYRAESERKNNEEYLVSQYDLASRLSYFLWSSMPDQTLFDLAKSGKLKGPDEIERQVKRMLLDEKSKALSMHFAGQWFGWELLRSTANPDETKYPQFTFQLRVALYRESAVFFEHLIATNASSYDLIDCNYAFLNEQLARHYQIPGVTGPELRKVTLNNRARGGVLGMGSVLTATSLPLRSSPAARGDYVLTELLGTPPPEPPMNVAQLPEDDRAVKAKTFREALVQHRQDPNCKACHELIDPIGFGLENFDAIGRWRTSQNGIPLKIAGEMPDGTRFSSIGDLKERLMNDKELFARLMVSKMLSYALGRELTPYDRPVIRNVTNKVVADNGRIHTAFIEVAKSFPFRYRRNDDFVVKIKR